MTTSGPSFGAPSADPVSGNSGLIGAARPPKAAPKQRPARRAARRGHRRGMTKTGARILGGFAAALVAWLWSGWGEPATGVSMGDAMLTSLGGAAIVIVEWILVKDS